MPKSVRKRPIGEQISFFASLYGVTDVIPFSCFHNYQRSDSTGPTTIPPHWQPLTRVFLSQALDFMKPLSDLISNPELLHLLIQLRSRPEIFEPEYFETTGANHSGMVTARWQAPISSGLAPWATRLISSGSSSAETS